MTISMCLFIYYRKQPAVRATSYILSLCMFIGCYFLLTSSFFQDITSGTSVYGSKQSLRTFICMFDVFISNVGNDMILATVIAKTLHIYFIFKTFGKISKLFWSRSLHSHLKYHSVKIIMLIIWTGLDVPHVIDVEQFIFDSETVPPFSRYILQQCHSVHHELWVILMFGYSTLLTLLMV